MFDNRVVTALIVVVGVPIVTVAYVALVEWILERLPYLIRQRLRPWLWVIPALVLMGLYLIYPAVNTSYISLYGPRSEEFVGVGNYQNLFTNRSTLLAMRNNLLWLVLLPLFTVGLGLIFAVLFDRVRYEAVAKSIVFVPMAISAVAAGVIWRLVFDFKPAGQPQTGTLNAIVTLFGGEPVPWLIRSGINNVALILVGVWMWTGFATVILSAGLKGIPTEIIEAARVDGATEFQILTRVTIPMMASTIAVVATTIVINALKLFDIVYVMTSGNYGTDVIAVRMYKEMFQFRNFGRASAIAVVLLVAIVPIMIFNIRRFREQEAIR
ncbi:MAG: sugar ABC transporter permease [Chloroflexi bacterium]|nr:sugar ABC transporter permease [Chloroflexota bacterium]